MITWVWLHPQLLIMLLDWENRVQSYGCLKSQLTPLREIKLLAILRRCTTLRSDKNPEDIRRIYITPDLTPKEREANSKLRSELAELNKNGKEYMIKSGK